MSDVSPVIPADIAEFVTDRIGSVAELEAVLILHQNPQIRWSAQSMASRLYLPESATEDLLKRLCQNGLVAEELDQPPLYRYHPASADLRAKVDRVAAFYSTHLVAVTRLIHSKAAQRIQGFADAFKFRKDD